MAELARIQVFPVKSLDPIARETERIAPGGRLGNDRTYAIFDRNGEFVNGKRTSKVHTIRSTYDPDSNELELTTAGRSETRRFDVAADHEGLEAWLGEHFDEPVRLERSDGGGFPDDTEASGPTVISTATIREVASWFPELSTEEIRLRFRANLEIRGVPPFWEDRLYADLDEVVPFRIGNVRLDGTNPCQRCVVPTRDPHTGKRSDGFQETFVENRRRTLPEWANRNRFDHFYRLTVNTDVPESEWGKELRVGDPVEVGEPVPAEE